MADSLETKVTILGDSSSLERAAKRSAKDLHGLSKTTSKIAGVMKGALGAIAGAISIGAVVSVLKDATTAAMEDAKSQALLANQMKNSVKATKEMNAAAEESISKMSLMAAVPDDEIRPAFASFIRSTKSVKKATDLTSLALDVSSGTGKDLATVTKALTAAYGGNTKSLSKLGVNVKKGGNWMKELKRQYKGMADTAARQDPAKRMQVAFGELQESLGKGMLPILNKVADWVIQVSPQIQRAFEDMWASREMQQVKDLLKTVWEDLLIPLGQWITSDKVRNAFRDVFDAIINVAKSVGDFATSKAGKFLFGLVGETLLAGLKILDTLLTSIADTLDRLAGIDTRTLAQKSSQSAFVNAMNPFRSPVSGLPSNQVIDKTYGNMSNVGGRQSQVVNVYVTKTDPKAVIDEINKYFKSKGQGRISTNWY